MGGISCKFCGFHMKDDLYIMFFYHHNLGLIGFDALAPRRIYPTLYEGWMAQCPECRSLWVDIKYYDVDHLSEVDGVHNTWFMSTRPWLIAISRTKQLWEDILWRLGRGQWHTKGAK